MAKRLENLQLHNADPTMSWSVKLIDAYFTLYAKSQSSDMLLHVVEPKNGFNKHCVYSVNCVEAMAFLWLTNSPVEHHGDVNNLGQVADQMYEYCRELTQLLAEDNMTNIVP